MVQTSPHRNDLKNGVEVANAVANIAINTEDKVVSFGANFIKPGTVLRMSLVRRLTHQTSEKVSSIEPKVSTDEAIATAEQYLSGKYTGYPTSLEYVVNDDGSVVLTHIIQVESDHLLEAFVDARTNEVVAVNDFTYESAVSLPQIPAREKTHISALITSQFLAIPINRQGLDEGQSLLVNPEDRASSPDGWNTNSTGTL